MIIKTIAALVLRIIPFDSIPFEKNDLHIQRFITKLKQLL